MIKFDFFKYTDNAVDMNEFNDLFSKKDELIRKFHDETMIGWTKKIDSSVVDKIIDISNKVKRNSECLVVVGIGGSFLGSFAFNKMFSSYFNDSNFQVIYAGTTYSSNFMVDLLEYLKDIDFTLNVISKSGTTMETNVAYSLIKKLMEEKYTDEEIRERIIITTDKCSGGLRDEVNKRKYVSFEIPNDIGGRYSFMTPAHLFPLAFNYDIKKIISGYYSGGDLVDDAIRYAIIRYLLFKKGKYVENYCVFEENMVYFAEWLKQLFGETEGKNGKGILPMSVVYSRDLHSLGQFVQDGHKILFETFINIPSNKDLACGDLSLAKINDLVFLSSVEAHYSGGVPCVVISLDEFSAESVSCLMYFFMLSAVFSALLFEVNPFDQPGVEIYKREIRDHLNGKRVNS